MAWYIDSRPKNLDEVIGQNTVVKVLQSKLKSKSLPHFLLFAGPSGVGKTTVARTLKDELECGDSDFVEVNGATERGIDDVRDIRRSMNFAPIGGKCRIWLIDEAHKLTPDAQTALLKPTEDTPKHVYFIFASSEPDKLIKAIQTRAMRLEFKALSDSDLREVMRTVLAAQDAKADRKLLDEIVESCDGSARQALMLLEQACALETIDEQLESIVRGSPQRQAIELCRMMLANAKWGQVAKYLKEVKEDPEKIRRMILGYMTNVVLSGGKDADRAARALALFRDNWYDCGRAGLVSCCWEFFSG